VGGEKHNLFEQFMEQIPAVIGIHDDEERIVYMNSTANSFFTKENAAGSLLCELLPKETADKASQLLKEAREHGHAKMIIEADNLKNNRRHIFKALAFTIKDKEQKVQIGTIYVDITKQQQNNQEISKLQQILNSSPVSIVITDIDGNIEYVNPFFSELTGYSLEEAIGKNPRVLKSDFHPEEEYKRLWDDILRGEVWNGTFRNIKKSGEEYWESAIIAPVKDSDGKITNFIGVKQEISEQMYLKEQLQESENEKIQNFEKTLESFVSIVEDRDAYTGGHSQRVAAYSKMIAQEMGCSHDDCELIYRAGTLHDIGKISTPDNILLKPDKLAELEYKLIKRHVETSYTILNTIPMYKEIAEIVLCHHERYDAKGYPRGIGGDDIPLLAQIMMVADAFDAMTTNRIYKAGKNIKEAIEELKAQSSKQFHPEVVKSAAEVLQHVTLQSSINQLPVTELEKERFAYFYRDQVTDAYNSKYLNNMLNQNSIQKEFICVNIIYMHNFSTYNEKYGWAKGDLFLRRFADGLIERFPKSFVFRIHGDDFVIIAKSHIDISTEDMMQDEMFKESGITLSYKHVDLRQNNISNLHELEMVILKHN
jgi:PAS domain S-box-containing protein/diguanylate cyclase (GGDEF)-like protein/putative nucleotidyltransferase with HDIG domain